MRAGKVCCCHGVANALWLPRSVLGALRSLRTLDLAFTRIGPGGARAVAKLEHLRVLNLRCAASVF